MGFLLNFSPFQDFCAWELPDRFSFWMAYFRKGIRRDWMVLTDQRQRKKYITDYQRGKWHLLTTNYNSNRQLADVTEMFVFRKNSILNLFLAQEESSPGSISSDITTLIPNLVNRLSRFPIGSRYFKARAPSFFRMQHAHFSRQIARSARTATRRPAFVLSLRVVCSCGWAMSERASTFLKGEEIAIEVGFRWTKTLIKEYLS